MTRRGVDPSVAISSISSVSSTGRSASGGDVERADAAALPSSSRRQSPSCSRWTTERVSGNVLLVTSDDLVVGG